MMYHIFQFMPTMVMALVAMAFLTLLERKSLSYMQLRKGPNKLGFMGIPQPLADALKLLTKSNMYPTPSNPLVMSLAPVFAFILALSLWYLYPTFYTMTHKSLSLLLLICISAMMVYPILLGSWSSNSKYALLGAVRAMAQMISYEIPMILVLIFFTMIDNTLDISALSNNYKLTVSSQLAIPMALTWLTIVLAETSRTPFDFSEGESELVSGFNVEYSGTGFALFFMAEYLNILFMSLISSLLIFNVHELAPIFAFMFLLARGTFPRHRYDLMMNMAWESLIPISLNFILFIMPLMYI
uniref:NADH-ubiquinone oxidoreductase chain 1 n=1 Tax=Lanceolaria lanceolata TaxID=2508263 RepID=A0A1W5HZB6_LANLA|nr:NADH dehydrogenase subunit 1 [Lanceolaria lanceolata]